MAYISPIRIDESNGTLNVQSVPSSRSPVLAPIILLAILGVMFTLEFPSGDLYFRATVVGCVGLVFLFQFIRSFFPSGESLQCDNEMLTVGKIPMFNFSGEWIYQTIPISEIKRVQFTVITIRRYGGGTGLKIEGAIHIYKVFEGMQAPEASKVLEGLANHRVPVLRDPTMPMMIEMAMSRRNSKFSWFLGS